jgi:hypothetical protein
MKASNVHVHVNVPCLHPLPRLCCMDINMAMNLNMDMDMEIEMDTGKGVLHLYLYIYIKLALQQFSGASASALRVTKSASAFKNNVLNLFFKYLYIPALRFKVAMLITKKCTGVQYKSKL